MYANIYSSPRFAGEKAQEEMSQELRALSSTLQSNMHLIPYYNLMRFLFGLPSKKNVVNAAQELIFIHNGHDGLLENQGILNCYAAQKIRISLSIFIPDGEYLNPDHERHCIKAKGN